MRHRKKKITLDRKTGPRQALLTNLAVSLILFERVKTTRAKGKALQALAERCITRAKKNNLVVRRFILKQLGSKSATRKLLEVFGPRYQGRAGGYTRLLLLPERRGDGAQQAVVEFV